MFLDDRDDRTANDGGIGKLTDLLKLFSIRNSEAYRDWQRREAPEPGHELSGVGCNLALFSGNPSTGNRIDKAARC